MPFIRLKKEPGKENNANAQVVDRRCKRKNPENKKPAWPWRNWHGPFPTLLSKRVFIPNNWPTSRWWVASLPANTKWPSDYKRTVNPQEIIIIMSDIQRLTLISDPTNKFSQNANNSFKVWLSECLTLPGDQWHASLLSMTVPDEGQSSGVIARDPHTKVVGLGLCMAVWKKVLGTYRLIEFKRKEYAVELEDVMNADLFVTSDLLFWQRVMQVVHNKVMIKLTKEQEDMLLSDWDEIPTVGVKKNGCQPWGGKKMLWYCMLYPKWNWWTQPKRQLWPPLPLTFLWPKSLGSLSKHWLGGTSWDPIYNSPSPTSPTRTRQNLPTPRCDQPIIGMENIMWGLNPSIWWRAWWTSYSKWKITDCNCRSKWNGVWTTSMPPSKRSWVSDNVWRWCIQMWWNPRWWGVANFPSCAKCSYQEQAMDEVPGNPCITNGLKFEGINWISLKWRLPRPTDSWPSYLLAKPSWPLDSNSYKNATHPWVENIHTEQHHYVRRRLTREHMHVVTSQKGKGLAKELIK